MKSDALLKALLLAQSFNFELEKYEKRLSQFQFYMFRYKTAWCPRIQNKHDWSQCIYAHRLQDFRRMPDKYHYKAEECQHVTLLNGGTVVSSRCAAHSSLTGFSWENCSEGLHCQYSHSTFERLYHPQRYKIVCCEVYRQCNRFSATEENVSSRADVRVLPLDRGKAPGGGRGEQLCRPLLV